MKNIIKKPIISEKNSLLAEELGVYTFEVDSRATKPEVKNAIEKSFKVKVRSVNTVNCRSRATRNRLGVSKVKYWKKALVRLQPGEKIAMFEGA